MMCESIKQVNFVFVSDTTVGDYRLCQEKLWSPPVLSMCRTVSRQEDESSLVDQYMKTIEHTHTPGTVSVVVSGFLFPPCSV
jgi:hypothetical protein